MMSSSMARNSVQVMRSTPPFCRRGGAFLGIFAGRGGRLGAGAEVAAEPLAQLQTGPQQARLDGRNRKTQGLGGFFRREILDVAQDKNHPESARQPVDGAAQNVRQ